MLLFWWQMGRQKENPTEKADKGSASIYRLRLFPQLGCARKIHLNPDKNMIWTLRIMNSEQLTVEGKRQMG